MADWACAGKSGESGHRHGSLVLGHPARQVSRRSWRFPGASASWWPHGQAKQTYRKNTVARNQAYSFMTKKASIGPMEFRVVLNTSPRASISAAMTSEFAP